MTSPSFDASGLGSNTTMHSASSGAVSVTTTTANDLILLVAAFEGATQRTVSTVTSAHLTFTKYSEYQAGLGQVTISVWTAPATGALTAESITVTLSGSVDGAVLAAIGVVGTVVATPWDPNVSLPGTHQTTTGGTIAATISTTNKDDLLLDFQSGNGNGSAGTGPGGAWSTLATLQNNSAGLWSTLGIFYQSVSAAQSSLTVTNASSPSASAILISALTADHAVNETGAVALAFGGIKMAAAGSAKNTNVTALHFGGIKVAVNGSDTIIPPGPPNGGITGGGIGAAAIGAIPDIRLSALGPIPQGYFLGRTAQGQGDVQLLPLTVLPSANQVGQALSNTQKTIARVASIAQNARNSGVSQSTSLSQISSSLSQTNSTEVSLSSAISTSLSGHTVSLSQISSSLSQTNSTEVSLSTAVSTVDSGQTTSLSQISSSLSQTNSTEVSLSSAVSTSLSGHTVSLSQISSSLSQTNSTEVSLSTAISGQISTINSSFLPLTGGTLTGNLLINENVTTNPPLLGSSQFYIVGLDTIPARGVFDAYGSGGSAFIFRTAAGTAASPAAVTSGLGLGAFGFRGYTGAAFSSSMGIFQVAATQNWTAGAQGTQISFSTTPNGTAAAAVALTIGQDASLTQGASNVFLTAGNSLKVPVSTVAGLPSASTEGAGAIRAVNNALTPAIGVAVVGGGAVFCLVLSNGTTWIAC